MTEKVDVLIVGSGHSGGMAAKVLTGKGINCLMLNAGPIPDFVKDRETRTADQLPYHGFNMPGRLPNLYQATEFNSNQWVDQQEVPYTFDREQPYNWVRVRLFGGRSLFWGRQSFRLSDFEFRARDYDGTGANWPIRLADLAPYYSQVESIFRVRGRKEGLPQYPDGNFIEENSPWSGCLQRFNAAATKFGMTVCKLRSAAGVNGLASSINLFLPDAFATGKLEAVPNAVVREITVDKNTGLVDGAIFLDRHSNREMTVKARVVVLAAGTLESTRLLLNSGLANSSGVLGHYLMDNPYRAGMIASVPEAREGKGRATPGLMGGTAFAPRFRNLGTPATRGKDFVGGYGLLIGAGGTPDFRNFRLYGAALQKKMESYADSSFSCEMYGSSLSRYENHVTIDKNTVDAWGIPALRINAKYYDNELNMARDAVDTSAAIAEAAGFEVLTKNYETDPPGRSIHEVGTCRMGDDPKTSVLNKWNQSHDIKNLFVVDGGAFVSTGWQNVTLTLTALSMRASEYLAEQMRQGNV
jgi:choline dehydrogenase-like flavoprotein